MKDKEVDDMYEAYKARMDEHKEFMNFTFDVAFGNTPAENRYSDVVKIQDEMRRLYALEEFLHIVHTAVVPSIVCTCVEDEGSKGCIRCYLEKQIGGILEKTPEISG